jgi:hypothetical protein
MVFGKRGLLCPMLQRYAAQEQKYHVQRKQGLYGGMLNNV